MTFAKTGRAFGLALLVAVVTFAKASAHALPGSVLTLSKVEERLDLTITLPVDDLAIAAPALAVLQTHPLDTPFAEPHLALLQGYLDAHLAVRTDETAHRISLQSAVLQQTYDEHLGSFLILKMSLAIEGNSNSGGLYLTYDAVMHEIRNHRAMVVWSSPTMPAQLLAEFGYRPKDGVQRPVLIDLPDD
ncbi:hypothetical protein L0666_15040 [Octadecabacter sp. CECT 8868]|uniref:hypothetical protein n=1 Tax=Octadecabacter algicola TaxID=2909342 RepID=UPI001F3D7706|nr:hypothetical protein [Octadecabacter algicola]MCF2906308.1 hypothetical protein [Octadecabacter algicola]